MQADAMNMKPNYTGYDLIVMPNLLEELSDPKVFLSHIHERVNDGGCLIIVSAYNWDMSKTKREKWLGGFKEDGEPVTSLDGLKSVFGTHFDLDREPFNISLSLKRTSRITESRVLEVTVWKKK